MAKYQHAHNMLVDCGREVIFGITPNGWVEITVDREHLMTVAPAEAENMGRRLQEIGIKAAGIRKELRGNG